MKILYVEDNPIDAELVLKELKRQDRAFSCRVVGSLGEARGIIATNQDYDLILIDISLPDGSGLELLREIRQKELGVAVAVLTGSGDEDSAVAALKSGADDYIVKSDGYLQELPRLLKDALSRFKDEIRRRSHPIAVLYAELNIDDVNLTIRHCSKHAPHIRFDTVPSAAGVIERLSKAAQDHSIAYDVLLLDYRLPDMSALDLIKILRQEKILEMPAVLTTGHGSEEAAVQALRLGFSDYLIKSPGYLFKLPGTLENAYQSLQLLKERNRLAKSEARNRFQAELLRNAPVIAAFYDLKNQIVWVNRAYEEAVGLPLDEIAGKKCYSVWGHTEFCENCPIVNAVESGEPQEAELTFQSREHRLGDKSCWLSRGAPVRDNHGNVVGSIEIALDISDRKKAELQQERLMTAIEQAGESILITDPRGTIEYVNPSFGVVTGYFPEEIIGKTPSVLNSGEQDEAFYQDLWETISSGMAWKGRMVNKRKDGTFYTEESTISPVKDASGNIVNYVAVKRDISAALRAEKDRVELQGQLQQAQKLESVGRLAGGVAHDFNNMLNIIIGYGENILNNLHREDPLRDYAKEIVAAGKRSAALTRQLLAFSRKQALQPLVLNLNEVIRNIDRMLRRLIGEDIDLKLSLSEDIDCVMADPGQVEQVILNLAVNARDAMPQGGNLTIETKKAELDELYAGHHTDVKPGKYVMLAVTDTGCGMSKETVTRIFDPFYTTKEMGKGTGLGLSTVYGIVEQSGGKIWVYSEPGQGTTFKIYIPVTDAVPFKEEKSVVTKESAGGEVILVVEDEEALRKLMGIILLRLGYKVHLAANGGEAMLMVENGKVKPDLIITDVVMPKMSGKELVEALQDRQLDFKVLYMSGYTDSTIVHHGVLDSDTPFIQKPFTIHDIADKIHQVLRNSNRRHPITPDNLWR